MIDTNNRNWEFLRNLSKIVNWDKVKAVNRDGYYSEHKDEGKKNKYRSRVCMLELYPEHDEDMNFVYELIATDSFPYAIILHDKDKFLTDKEGDENGLGAHHMGDYKKPHIHCVVKFKNGKTNTAVAKMFRLNPRFVEMWDSASEALGYLDHHKYINKHVYDVNEIYGNLPIEVYQAHEIIHDKYVAFDTLVNFIKDSDYISITEVYEHSKRKHIIETCLNHWNKLNALVLEHNAIQKMIYEKMKEGKI